eukprot:2945904-Alexandrium_andersonii.AAC.1
MMCRRAACRNKHIARKLGVVSGCSQWQRQRRHIVAFLKGNSKRHEVRCLQHLRKTTVCPMALDSSCHAMYAQMGARLAIRAQRNNCASQSIGAF